MTTFIASDHHTRDAFGARRRVSDKLQFVVGSGGFEFQGDRPITGLNDKLKFIEQKTQAPW